MVTIRDVNISKVIDKAGMALKNVKEVKMPFQPYLLLLIY